MVASASLLKLKRLSTMLEQCLYTNFINKCDTVLGKCIVTTSPNMLSTTKVIPSCVPAFGAVTTTPFADAHKLCVVDGVEMFLAPAGKSWSSDMVSPFHVIMMQTTKQNPNMIASTMTINMNITPDLMLVEPDSSKDCRTHYTHTI